MNQMNQMNQMGLSLYILAETAIVLEKIKNGQAIDAETIIEQVNNSCSVPEQAIDSQTVPKKRKSYRDEWFPEAQGNQSSSEVSSEPLNLTIDTKSPNLTSSFEFSSEHSSNSPLTAFDESTSEQKPTILSKKDQFNKYIKESVKLTAKIDEKATSNGNSLDNIKVEVKTLNMSYIFNDLRDRKPSTKTPDSMKDEEYFEKRRLNNEAARKSRQKKEIAIRTAQIKLEHLKEERKNLNEEFEKEILMMKLFQLKMTNDSEFNERATKLIDEGKLSIFKRLLNNGPLD